MAHPRRSNRSHRVAASTMQRNFEFRSPRPRQMQECVPRTIRFLAVPTMYSLLWWMHLTQDLVSCQQQKLTVSRCMKFQKSPPKPSRGEVSSGPRTNRARRCFHVDIDPSYGECRLVRQVADGPYRTHDEGVMHETPCWEVQQCLLLVPCGPARSPNRCLLGRALPCKRPHHTLTPT